MTKKTNRGGLRNPPGGRPPLPPDQKRQTKTLRLAPGIKEMAQLIAKERGLSSWGKLLDELVRGEAARLETTIKKGEKKMVSDKLKELADEMNKRRFCAEKFIGNNVNKQYWTGARDEAMLVLVWLKREGISPTEGQDK